MHFTSLLAGSVLLSLTQGLVLDKRAARTSSPSGCLVVQPKNTASGEYATIAAANTALGSGKTAQCIFINPGTYKEQVKVSYAGALTIYGYTTDTSNYANNQVIIASSTSSAAAGNLDASAAMNFVGSGGLKVYNINFSNTFGTASQAVAVVTNGDYQGFYGCQFLGNQDTLYAKDGQQYYKSCYIEGTVDFIFGNAAAWFESCTIAVKRAKGVITAMSRTTSTDASWYVFNKCTIQAATGFDVTAGTVNLGRPWRVFARVMYQNSVLSDIISAAGWTTMAAGATPVYQEYKNTGDGADTSDRLYLTKSTAAVSQSTVLTGDLSWLDATY